MSDDYENDEFDTDVEDSSEYKTSGAWSAQDSDDEAAVRENMRQQLQSDVEAFLASGGSITEVPPNVVADPPKKPQSNYGGQPI